MAPKTNCNSLKLSSCLAYFQRTRVAHTIKDLEKQLPSVASINGMQVKDYLQTLQDENKICVEKIGSGNWYWSFPSQDQIVKQKILEEVQSGHDKAFTIVQDLKQNLADKAAQREEEEDMLDTGGDSREEVMGVKGELEAELKQLQKELAAYRDSDPTELERKQKETKELLVNAEQYTDEIYSLEGWFQKLGADEAVKGFQQMFYGDEYDEEEGGLRELV